MDAARTTPIDIAEAAYNLELGGADWLPNLLETGQPMLDYGLGCAGAIWAGQSIDGEPLITQLCVGSGPPDLAQRFARAAREVGSKLAQQTSSAGAGGVRAASESKDQCPEVFEALTKHVGCEDVLGLWAMDPDLHGVGINIPSPELVDLRRGTRLCWERLAVHIAAGQRVRRGLGCADDMQATPVSEIPLDADAVIDPKRFMVAHAEGPAQDKAVAEVMREAAIRIDKARGELRRTDSDRALELWEGFVRGRWSLVDWFDSDDRRFVLVVPNAPNFGDPRGLTEREHQVAAYAARGESNKLIGYSLGISPQRVSTLRAFAMHKLGVRTQAQLVLKFRTFQASRRRCA